MLKQFQLTRIKKILLSAYVILLVFIIPILLVQRGVFIHAAFILTAVVYLTSNRKLRVLLACLVIIFGGYSLGSALRGYSDAQLSVFFRPKDIIGSTTEQNQTENDPFSEKTLRLSPKMAFLYSYLTVGHDNFDSAVENNTEKTWGIWQVKPFNVILRSDWIEARIAEAESNSVQHRVLFHLTTFNFVSGAYYNFGAVGVIVLVSLWSFCFGLVEEFNKKYKGVFSALTYGVIMTPVALCFYESWMSIFTVWLLWGTILLMFLAGSVRLKKRLWERRKKDKCVANEL
jgi:hypothetical protein